MVDPRLRAIVAAFASGQCPQGVLADYLADVLDDPRADVVRKAKVDASVIIEAAELLGFRPWPADDLKRSRGYDKARSMVRRRILARFPEAYSAIEQADQLSDLPGIGICRLEEGEQQVGQAVFAPDENGCFDMFVRRGTGYETIPCRIGYHVPQWFLLAPGVVSENPTIDGQPQWRNALAEPEPARTT